MTTDPNCRKYNLPHHRRVLCWRMFFKPHMRAIRLAALGIIVGLLVFAGELWIMQHGLYIGQVARAERLAEMERAERRALRREWDYVASWGKCNATSFAEGDCDVEVRKPR